MKYTAIIGALLLTLCHNSLAINKPKQQQSAPKTKKSEEPKKYTIAKPGTYFPEFVRAKNPKESEDLYNN